MERHCGSGSQGAVGALLVVAALLSACGGGGGGGSNGGNSGGNGGGSGNPPPGLPYTGSTSAATLTSVNTPTIAGALLYEIGLASGSRPLPAQVGGPGLRFPDPARSLSKARQAKTAFFRKPVTTENCTDGGTVRVDDQTTANGTGSLILTFTGCLEDGVRSDGVQRVQIAAYDLAQDEPTDFTITFEGYSESSGGFGVDVPEQIVKRLSLIDGLYLERIGVEDGLADVTERAVHRVRERMHGRGLVVARDHDARAPVLLEVTHERVDPRKAGTALTA